MNRALLIGKEPGAELGFSYVREEPYDAVVIGSLTVGQMVCFREERVLCALAEGKSVILYTPGLPEVKNRASGAEKLGGGVHRRVQAASDHRPGGQTDAPERRASGSGGGADAPG